MKKGIAILLTILYLASFSGMLLGLDCVAHQPATVDSGNSFVPGHSTADNSHPFLQVCKLIEVHKEVVVTGHVKKFRSAPVTLVSTNHILSWPGMASDRQVNQPLLITGSSKLFLQHCVLLI